MKNVSFLKKDLIAPDKRETFLLIFLIILPNIFFLAVAFYTSTARPLFNLDYLIALLMILLPYKIMRVLGSIILVLAMLFDVLMFVVQIFPFMDLAAVRYLSSFIFIAPTNYIVMLMIGLIAALCIVGLNLYLSKNIKQPYPSFMLFSLIIIAYVFMTLGISYTRFYGILGRDNYYIAHSQSRLYYEITNSDFWSDASVVPKLQKLKNEQMHAANELKQPYSYKILYIVAESWGELRNVDAQKSIMQNIFKQKENLEFINDGSFHTSGATVAGELRELCGLELINNGFAFKQLNKNKFSDCLPEQLKQQGYQTVALHGTSGLLYDRVDWYSKAGFQQTLFGENFMNLRRCTPFKGVCDSELMNIVAQNFKRYSQKKIFLYWMTLTSHQPYANQDIHNHRFDCSSFNMSSKGDACHNAQLETQFFDDLAQLIQKPEMNGVEVVVVGDHQPPMWGDEINHVRPLTVSYLHFKVKASSSVQK